MPLPTQTQALRVKHLVAVVTAFLEDGVDSHLLFDKLVWGSFRLWPELREETRRSYVVTAHKVVLSQPPVEFNLLTETASQQEGK